MDFLLIGRFYYIFQFRFEQPVSALPLIRKIAQRVAATNQQDNFWSCVYNHTKLFLYVYTRNHIVPRSLGKTIPETEETETYQIFPMQCLISAVIKPWTQRWALKSF